jgi:hypothetical protein
MNGRGTVKGILVEGNDGHEYLLGFGPDSAPIFSQRQADGSFSPLGDIRHASRVAIAQIGHEGGVIGPGMGQNTWLWGAFREALKSFPPIPTWPTWSA